MKILTTLTLAFLATAGWAADSATRSADIERIQSATTIMSQIMEAPDKGIPDSILSGAKCIAIVPSMLKISFIFGANYGKGVATCRTAMGWSTPSFFRMEGGSFGFQAGGQASDLVLVIRTDEGMQHLLQSKFKLGADASAAAGPVGRDAQAATDLTMRAQILTYSRSRGLFLGVSLSGSVVRQDGGDTQAFYGKDWTFYSLLNGEVPAPPDTQSFLATIERYAPTPRGAKPGIVPMTSPTANAVPAATPAPTASMADAAAAPMPPTDSADAIAPASAAPAPAAATSPAPQPAAAVPAVAPAKANSANPGNDGN